MSINYMRCPACKGQKRIKGLGMIEKDCADCKGVGFVEEIVVPSQLHVEDEPSSDMPKHEHITEKIAREIMESSKMIKRKGRPAKGK